MSDSSTTEEDVLRTDLHIQAAYRLTEAYVESEKKMRRRIEMLAEVVFETDSDGVIQYLNRAWSDLLGYDLDSSIGTKLSSYVLPEDRHILEDHFSKVPGTGLRSPIEMRMAGRDGSIQSVDVSAAALDEGGMVGTLFNVTQRNQALSELAKLSLVASYTDSLVVIMDPEGRIEWVNQGFSRTTGYSLEECVGREPRSFLQGPDTDPVTAAQIRQTLSEFKSFSCEILNYKKSGEEFWLSMLITPVRGPQSNVVRFVGVGQDITLLRQMQHDLQVAKEAAERASQAKSVFLAAMSHEIRTPLNGILGMVNLLQEGTLDEDQRQRANIIKSSSEALVTIVNDILDYSKIESGRFSLNSEQFAAKSVFDDTINLFRGNAETKHLRLAGNFEGDESIFVNGDRGRLRQVLMNLVSNAIKFTTNGGVTIDMVQRKVEESVELSVRVTDTGIGIAERDLNRLFVHFSQVDGSATRKQGGTGLGLAICKQLVEMMGGEIGVETKLGAGSTFWFKVELPIATRKAMPTAGPPSRESFDFAGMRALIAEDNSVNQIVLKGILDSLGCKVDVVENGREAVERISQGAYDFVLMDVHMPEMDGIEATLEIRRSSRIPIVAVTANVLPEHIKTCYDSGMDGFVPKPISRHTIETELVRVLAGPSLQGLDAGRTDGGSLI